MTRNRITDTEYAEALEVGRRQAETEFRAQSVRYVADRDAVEIMTTRDGGFVIPRARIQELRDVPVEALAGLDVWPDGSAIEIDELDVHISVHGLLSAILPSMVPPQAIASLFARHGGAATSPAKRESARANGQKGGRPRKVAGAG